MRRQKSWQEILGYLRYVFNDHFVIALLFLLGLVLYQYRQLLQSMPKNPTFLVLGSIVLLLASLLMGQTATYLLPADKYYLLPQEEAVVREMRSAFMRSSVVWGVFQLVLVLLLAPLYLAAGVPLLALLALAVFLVVAKTGLLWYQLQQSLRPSGGLDWDRAIRREEARKQRLLKFFALFTTVKGITPTVHKRSYLNPLLKHFSQTPERLWDYLYVRAFLRSSDYLALTLRLTLLSSLVVYFLAGQVYVAIGLSLVFNYLLLFQLLALYYHYDYYDMAQLYPQRNSGKVAGLKRVLRLVLVVAIIIQSLVMAIHQPLAAVALLLLNGILVLAYSWYRGKKFVDE